MAGQIRVSSRFGNLPTNILRWRRFARSRRTVASLVQIMDEQNVSRFPEMLDLLEEINISSTCLSDTGVYPYLTEAIKKKEFYEKMLGTNLRDVIQELFLTYMWEWCGPDSSSQLCADLDLLELPDLTSPHLTSTPAKQQLFSSEPCQEKTDNCSTSRKFCHLHKTHIKTMPVRHGKKSGSRGISDKQCKPYKKAKQSGSEHRGELDAANTVEDQMEFTSYNDENDNVLGDSENVHIKKSSDRHDDEHSEDCEMSYVIPLQMFYGDSVSKRNTKDDIVSSKDKEVNHWQIKLPVMDESHLNVKCLEKKTSRKLSDSTSLMRLRVKKTSIDLKNELKVGHPKKDLGRGTKERGTYTEQSFSHGLKNKMKARHHKKALENVAQEKETSTHHSFTQIASSRMNKKICKNYTETSGHKNIAGSNDCKNYFEKNLNVCDNPGNNDHENPGYKNIWKPYENNNVSETTGVKHGNGKGCDTKNDLEANGNKNVSLNPEPACTSISNYGYNIDEATQISAEMARFSQCFRLEDTCAWSRDKGDNSDTDWNMWIVPPSDNEAMSGESDIELDALYTSTICSFKDNRLPPCVPDISLFLLD